MKLDIKNFICFNNYSLTLPDNGLVLLKGDSGAGKTTLLKAIVYALWGRIPSQGKILTFNAKRAYVRLEYKNLVIERWTNPKHFQLTIINDSILTSIPDLKSGTTQQNEKDKHIKVKNNTGKYILKNAEAQDHIRETIRFGEEVFGYSSWVPQKSSSSILTETPAKQLEIIRTLSIGPHISRLKAMQLYLKTTIADLLSSSGGVSTSSGNLLERLPILSQWIHKENLTAYSEEDTLGKDYSEEDTLETDDDFEFGW